MPVERPNAVRMDGNPFTLVGPEIRVGDPAPDFSVTGTNFQPITLQSGAGKTRVFLSVTSLDTSVCDVEAKEFSRRAAQLPDVQILVVSVDLPFAQMRWCGASGVTNLAVGSDHRELSFGEAYGVVVKELRQLSRAAFVVDGNGIITYVEYVPEIGDQPDFDAVMRAAAVTAGAA
ncbi:MAG: thiol peroxidase [Planctomycetota bacterium]|jgi:thiol peroxidase